MQENLHYFVINALSKEIHFGIPQYIMPNYFNSILLTECDAFIHSMNLILVISKLHIKSSALYPILRTVLFHINFRNDRNLKTLSCKMDFYRNICELTLLNNICVNEFISAFVNLSSILNKSKCVFICFSHEKKLCQICYLHWFSSLQAFNPLNRCGLNLNRKILSNNIRNYLAQGSHWYDYCRRKCNFMWL